MMYAYYRIIALLCILLPYLCAFFLMANGTQTDLTDLTKGISMKNQSCGCLKVGIKTPEPKIWARPQVISHLRCHLIRIFV